MVTRVGKNHIQGWQQQVSNFIIPCIFFFPFIGLVPTTRPTNNFLQIMVCSWVILSKCLLLQIIFCSCVIASTPLCASGDNRSAPTYKSRYFVQSRSIIDLSHSPPQCVWKIAPERGWGGHFHTFAIFLSTLTSTWRYCLLECGKGLLLIVNVLSFLVR